MSYQREVSLFIPYKFKDGQFLVYLQKRAKDAQRLPDYYGFFGGGRENDEEPEETLLREIKEEMDFRPIGHRLFGSYTFERSIMHTFILEVDDDFEKNIKILEGEYGRYFTEEEIIKEPKLIETDKVVLKDIYKLFKTEKRV